MKKLWYIVGAAALLGSAYAVGQVPHPSGQREVQQSQARSVSGQVTDKSEKPLADAVVYLKNMRTLTIRTFVANDKGEYQFNGLPANADFEVYAEYQGKRSPVRGVSSFDSRRAVVVHLKIDTEAR